MCKNVHMNVQELKLRAIKSKYLQNIPSLRENSEIRNLAGHISSTMWNIYGTCINQIQSVHGKTPAAITKFQEPLTRMHVNAWHSEVDHRVAWHAVVDPGSNTRAFEKALDG